MSKIPDILFEDEHYTDCVEYVNVCFNKFGDAQLPTYVMEIVNSDVRMIDSHPSKKCS